MLFENVQNVPQKSLKREVRREAGESGIRQFGQSAEVIDRIQPDTFSAQRVDGLRLLVAQVRMSRKSFYGAGVNAQELHIAAIGCEMMKQRVERQLSEHFIL